MHMHAAAVSTAAKPCGCAIDSIDTQRILPYTHTVLQTQRMKRPSTSGQWRQLQHASGRGVWFVARAQSEGQVPRLSTSLSSVTYVNAAHVLNSFNTSQH
jgi:hypothetical protein